MANNDISGLSLQAVEFLSAIKHIGAAIIVPHTKNKNTTVSSAGYIFITWLCEVIRNCILVSWIRFSIAGRGETCLQKINEIPVQYTSLTA